jgi:dolichol kinase
MRTPVITDRGLAELQRKSLHLVTVLYPILYNMLSYSAAVMLSATVIIVDIILETIRLLYPPVNRTVLVLCSGMYREKERERVSTLIWTLSGAFLTILLFPDRQVVTLALLYLVFGDSVAAVVGVIFGSTRVGSRGKSIEGSLAFFGVAFLCGVLFFPWNVALIGAATAATIEFVPLPFDDNFVLPVISAGVLTTLV